MAIALVAGGAVTTTVLGHPVVPKTPTHASPVVTVVDPSARRGQEFADRLLVYGPNGFSPADLTALSRALQARPVAVTVGQVFVPSGAGPYADPLATMVVDPDAYANAVGRPASAVNLAAALAQGVVVSRSTAGFLGLRVGDVLKPRPDVRMGVAAIVSDTMLGGYQAAVGRRRADAGQLGLGDHTDYAIVRAKPGQAPGVRRTITSALPARALRFVEPNPRAYFSPSGNVLSQAQIQGRFGVLRVRRDAAGLSVDPAWVAANIRTRHVALLGLVVCHEKVMAALVAAMTQLKQQALGRLVETADFTRQGGCWNPRTTRGRTALSHHAWGIAVDINVAHNPLGAPPRQDPRLVAVMQAHGFTWGGRWLRPDGAHFEWVGSPFPGSDMPEGAPEDAATGQ